MPITCPDPATLFRWRDTMAQAGVGLLIAVALFVVALWVTRPSGWPLRLAAGFSAVFALGVAAISFTLFTRLNDAPAQVARWFPGYPYGCDPPFSHGPPQFWVHVQAAAQQAVAPLERAAAIDLTVAVLALAALGLVALRCVRASSRRDMTSVTLDS